ncbi:YaeQ family protein [Massilia sp. W12]|uniref:YaeQ family protein n=1 Tax=Massilia sp. W12 TaxID=3126507 RepID=UPI0030D41797
MALKSSIYKAQLNVADMERNHFADYSLTLARHPSETEERLMMRILAFAMRAQERLEPARGLSDVEEPDLWAKDYGGQILEWIELGQPDEKRLQKAQSKSDSVWVLCYNHAAHVWFKQLEGKLARSDRLQIWHLPSQQAQSLAAACQRNMQVQVTLQEGSIWFTVDQQAFELQPARWL